MTGTLSVPYSREQIDAVLAHPGTAREAGAAHGVGHASVRRFRSGRLPVWYRHAKASGASSGDAPPPKRASNAAYTVAQIDAVLEHEGLAEAAAEAVGVPLHKVWAWRAGRLPTHYRAAKAETDKQRATSTFAAIRAGRFVRPQDARAAR